MNRNTLPLIIILIIAFVTSATAQTVPLYQFTHPKKKILTNQTTRPTVANKLTRSLSDTTNRANQFFLLNSAALLSVGNEATRTDSLHKLYVAAKSFLAKTPDEQRAIELQALRDSVKNIATVHDTLLLQKLYRKIDSIKIYNTDEFLTTLKPSQPFLITHLGKYKIDSLNKYLYNQGNVAAFQNAGIQNFTGSNSYITTELASFLFGPLRMGVGGTFLTKGDTSKDNAIKSSIQKIISNGGAINFNFSLPLVFSRSMNDQMHFGLFAQSNNGINPGIDSAGTTDFSKNVSFINQTGLVFHYDVGSNDSKALLSFDLPCYYVFCSNNAKTQLGLSNFSMIRLQIGATISGLFNIHISGPLVSSSNTIQNTPFIVSLQFSPGQILKSKSNN